MRTKFLAIGFALLACAPFAHAGGQGTFTVAPSTIFEGTVFDATATYVVPSAGLSVGGGIRLTLPVSWGIIPQTTNTGGIGFVSLVTTATASFSVIPSTFAPVVTVMVVSGTVPPASAIGVHLQHLNPGCPIPSQTGVLWTLSSQLSSADTAATVGTAAVESFVTGPATQLTYNPWNTLLVVAGAAQPTPLAPQVSDNCGQPVSLSAPLSVMFQGFQNNASGDPGARFSSSPAFTAPSPTLSVVIPAGSTSTVVYYETTTPGTSLSVNGSYVNPLYGYTQVIGRQVNALGRAPSLGPVSVDNGTPVAGQTFLALTPDGDGINDSAFIRFAPSDPTLTWHVVISSSNFATNVFERYGNGNPQGTLVWDGRNQSQTSGVISVVPNGTYQVKVEFPGLAADTSLSISVNSAQISGTVLVGGAPVSGAQVNAQNTSGPGYSSAITDVNGQYLLTGLKSGALYNLSASYASAGSAIPNTGQLMSVPAPSSGQAFALSTPGVIRVSAVISNPAASTVYGNLNANSTDYTQNYYGTLRLLAGATTSDNGDYFNPSSWTVLYVKPNVLYVLQLSMPGFGVNNTSVTVSAGAIVDVRLALTQKASVYGLVTLSAPATQSNLYVNVQGTLRGTTASTVFGGASFAVGQSSAVYSIYAVDPGVYQFTATIPGYVPQNSAYVTVGTADLGNVTSGGGVDFSGFSTGDTVSGVITITGDTSGQPNPFTLWVNAYSPTLGLNSFSQVQVSPGATSVPYQLSGLADGQYQISPPYLSGFTSTPNQTLVTVGPGTNPPFNITVAQNTGTITGHLTLRNGATDYGNVHLSLQGPVSLEENVSPVQPTYTLDHLGSGYYTLVATYLTTGAQVQTYTVLTNGQTQTVDLDLSAPTFQISGTVSVQSGFSMKNSSGTSVTVSSLSDLLTNATNQTLLFGGQTYNNCYGGTPLVTSTARVEAFSKTFNSYNNANRSSLNNCFGVGQYNYGVIDSSGNYEISGLTPGVWEVDVYPYFDNGQSPDVATVQQFITVSNASVPSVNFALSNGNSVSGSVSLPTGVSDTVTLLAEVLDSQGNLNQEATLQIGAAGAPASSTNFQFANLPAGTFSLFIQDEGVYDATTGQNITRYVAKPLAITINGSDLTGQSITMNPTSRIVGKLAIQQTNPQTGSTSVTLLTSANSNLLPSNFYIYAQPDPSSQGGGRSANGAAGVAGIGLDANNQFTIDGLQPGTYDVMFQQNSYSASFQGQGSINIAAYTQGSVSVPSGQTVNLGTITLLPGVSVSGNVTDQSNNPLGNILVQAQPSNSQNGNNSTQAYTDSQGNFTLAGLSPTIRTYDITAAPRPSPGDSNQPVPYGQVVLQAVDVTKVSSAGLRFSLPSATASMIGKIVTADGGALSYPQGQQAGYPEAALFVQLEGTVDENNPLGQDNATALDGSFNIPYLAAGVYDVTVESLGYRPVKLTGITLGTGGVKDLGTITLQNGPSLKVTLLKPDGSSVSTSDVQMAVAVNADLSNILFGRVNSDANTNVINSIQFAGFDLSPVSYSVLLFDNQSNITAPVEGQNIVFTSTSDALVRALTFAPAAPTALTHLYTSGGSVVITYYFSRPLRNRLDDQDPSQWFTVTSGPNNLSGYAISGDRRQLSVLYTPVPGQQNATIAFAAHTIDIDPSTGSEFALTKTITVLLGQKATAEGGISPVLGGSISLSDNNDPSTVKIPSNALLTSSGTAVNSSTNYTVTFTATDDPSSIPLSAGTRRAQAVSQMTARGAGAYVSEAFDAMRHAQDVSINPLSSFYSVLLPAGLSHSLNQTAFITLSYDTTADPTQINVYYFDGAQYLIQQNLRTIDLVNHTITVGVTHFSTFVVLQNSAPLIQVAGTASTDQQIEVFNFPNPFNLQSKTKTLNEGGATPSITTNGTIIHYLIPSSLGGPAEIVIYDTVGEKVRTLDLGVPSAGVDNYIAWDGQNSSGHNVASGVYIGELKVGGQKRFWKMAVIK